MRILVLVFLSGCGKDFEHGDDDSPDAGLPDGGEVDGGPTLPASPDPPVLTPCPEGWREVPDADRPEITICDPWPETGPEDCAVDEAHFPGGAGCERIGTECPAGDFAEDLPVGATVLYVLAGAAAGGDGSEALPFATIDEGLAAAEAGTVVAVSKGEFDEEVAVPANVTLWGACVAETIVASSLPSVSSATVSLRAAGATVKNLQVGGVRVGIRAELRAAPVTIDSVVVSGASSFGVLGLDQSEIEAVHLVIRDTIAVAAEPGYGWGLYMTDGAHATLARSVVERSTAVGALVEAPGGTITATDTSFEDTRERLADGQAGIGLVVMGGGHADLERVVSSHNLTDGVRVNDLGSSLVATDLVIEDTDPGAGSGTGLNVYAGGQADVSRATIRRNLVAAAAAYDPSSEVLLTDVVLQDTDEGKEDGGGMGVLASGGGSATVTRAAILRSQTSAVQVYGADATLNATDLLASDTRLGVIDPAGVSLDGFDGATMVLTRALFERSIGGAIFLADSGTSLVATDLAVRDTRPRESDGQGGVGIQAGGGATIELERALVERSRQLGLGIHDAGAVLLATDLTIVDTLPREAVGDVGYGLDIFGGVRAELHRVRIQRSHNAGVIVAYAGTTFDGTDVEILDTLSEESSGNFGEGLEVLDEAVVQIDGARIAGNHRGGVEAFGIGTEVTLSNVVIERTLSREVGGGGSGISSVDGAHVSVTAFRISDNALCGIQLARGGLIDLADGEVARNAIGANVQTADFDVGRIQTGVVYRDNVTTLDATALPLPEASTGLEP